MSTEQLDSARKPEGSVYPALDPDNSREDSSHGNRKDGVHVEMVNMLDPKLDFTNPHYSGYGSSYNINGPHDYEHANTSDIKKGQEDEEISDFDMDLDDHEIMEQAWEDANFVERAILGLQNAVRTSYQFMARITKGHFLAILFLVCYAVYFIVAMCHKFGDEASHRLLAITILAVVIWIYPYVIRFVRHLIERMYGSTRLTDDHAQKWLRAKIICKWSMYVLMTAFMVYILVDEGLDRPRNMRAVPGLLVLLLVCLLLSSRPSRVNWHTIFWGVALQFVCAVFVLKWSFGRRAMLWTQDRFDEFFDNTKKGSSLVFGDGYNEHFFIFGAVPIFLFTNAVFTALYYLGVMQFIIRCIGKTLRFFLNTSYVEAMAVAATIFLEGIATVIMMRPFLARLTKSQLFTVLNGTLASLGGAYLAILSSFGISLEYLVPAMLISAPATFTVSKLMVPETQEIDQNDAKDAEAICTEEKSKYQSVIDAAQTGALSMLHVLGSVVVIAYTFFSFVTWINHTLGWFGDRVGIEDLSIELISSYLLYPLALAMGVEPDDCRRVAMLLGYRLGVYNLIAFLKLTGMKVNRFKYMEYMAVTNFTGTITKHRDDITLDAWNMTLTNGFISVRSEAIATYALSGFSSGLGVALMMSVIFTITPKRKRWITKAAIPALVAGNLATCMTGCFASMFF